MRTQAPLSRLWLQRLGISFFLCLGLLPTARAQHAIGLLPDTQGPVQIPVLTLSDCINIGLQQQPTISAARASIRSSEAARCALDRMVCASLISREVGFRKQQASLGIATAYAGLELAEREAIYAVTRCYCTVVYARTQERLAQQLVDKLDLARRNAIALVKKGDPDIQITQVDVEKLSINIDLVQLRLIEASTGVHRATAALKEAMGLCHEIPLIIASDELPETSDFPDRGIILHFALSRRGELVQASNLAAASGLEICAQGGICCFPPYKHTFAAAADIHSKPIPVGENNGVYRPGALAPEMPTILVGRPFDRVARAKELSYRSLSVVDKTRGLIALEAEDAYYKWEAASGKVRILRESSVKTAKIADVISGRFENGKVSGEDYIRARTLEDQTQAQLNEALYNHLLALAALERITAGGYVPSFRTSNVK